tara:strand:+ start:32 stop:244 length:213 start_codon:yes stop_codon:yes gene_type:complete
MKKYLNNIKMSNSQEKIKPIERVEYDLKTISLLLKGLINDTVRMKGDILEIKDIIKKQEKEEKEGGWWYY